MLTSWPPATHVIFLSSQRQRCALLPRPRAFSMQGFPPNDTIDQVSTELTGSEKDPASDLDFMNVTW